MLHCTNQQAFIYMLFFVSEKMSLWLDEIASRAGWNSFVDRIWPAGRRLETLL